MSVDKSIKIAKLILPDRVKNSDKNNEQKSNIEHAPESCHLPTRTQKISQSSMIWSISFLVLFGVCSEYETIGAIALYR